MTTELSPSMTLSVTRVPTMSSLEIAEITGKRHDNVMQDIRVLLEAVNEDVLKFQAMYLDTYKREKPCYRLPKDLTITLVAGYRADLRLRIVRRWMELEEANKVTAPALPNFSDPVIAARAWADEVEKKRIAEAARKFIGVNSNTMKQSLGKAEIYVTAKGIQTIAQLYKEGRLIMLKVFERTAV